MFAVSSKTIFRFFILIAFVFVISKTGFGQKICLTDDDVKGLINKPRQNASENKELKNELLKMREEAQKILLKRAKETYKLQPSQKRATETNLKHAAGLCQIIKQFGWPTEQMVGQEGADAATSLLINSTSFELQRVLLPLIKAATEKGDFKRQSYAMYIDRLLIRTGRKQIFGTQIAVDSGIIILYPILQEQSVEERRSKYNLPPLADYTRYLEVLYSMPLVKSPVLMKSAQDTPSDKLPEQINSMPEEKVDDEDVIRVDTKLVNLNVSIIGNNAKANIKTLNKDDFKIFEDGQAQSVDFFSTTEVPFDLVLLLDLSGSTVSKQDLIRKSTKRFIEAARPSDKIAIVTFTDTTKIVSPLTSDRQALLKSVGNIGDNGGSHIWDALDFALTRVFESGDSSRRKAIVLMTDGVDVSLASGFRIYPNKAFAEIVEKIRHDDTIIIPVYLDTENDTCVSLDSAFNGVDKSCRRQFAQSRKILSLFAEESGGFMYNARRIEDLKGIYEQVINDLGLIYSLGYKPINEKRDGTWRNVKIELPNRADLLVRTRKGYYAN